MNPGDSYLLGIINKYKQRDLSSYFSEITQLKLILEGWASSCFLQTIDSGSRAKGTAISLASDVDYLISLSSNCNENSGGLKSIYESLYYVLSQQYNVRKQNVSVRVNLSGLEVDITPARRQPGNTNDHWLYLSKLDTRKQTNIQVHIKDISQSGRLNEIKILKVWRELHGLDFPSVYLEYLLVNNILSGKSKGNDYLASNCLYALKELAKDTANPLFSRIVDPANSSNILSDLLNTSEKNLIIKKAKETANQPYWKNIVW